MAHSRRRKKKRKVRCTKARSPADGGEIAALAIAEEQSSARLDNSGRKTLLIDIEERSSLEPGNQDDGSRRVRMRANATKSEESRRAEAAGAVSVPVF